MTIHQFKKQFPHEDACLAYIFAFRFPELNDWYRVKGRKCWTNPEGTKQVYPLKGTIFEKSTTNLVSWFHAIYLFSVSKNGVSAMELQRQIGVTYKCAWRMCHQIRLGIESKKIIVSPFKKMYNINICQSIYPQV